MVSGDPLGVVRSGRRDSRAAGSLNGGLLLGGTSGLLVLGALSSAALLGEVGSDPDGVEEVDDAREASQEEEVQEEANNNRVSLASSSNCEKSALHLRVKDAGLRLNNADSAVVGVESEEVAIGIRDDGSEGEQQILGVHFGGEAVADALLLTGRDLNAVTVRSQVANNLAAFSFNCRQGTTNEVHSHGRFLLIGESDQRLGRVAIDKLDTEDLGGREGGVGRDRKQLGFREILLLSSILVTCDIASATQLTVGRWESRERERTAARLPPIKAWTERRARDKKPKRPIVNEPGIEDEKRKGEGEEGGGEGWRRERSKRRSDQRWMERKREVSKWERRSSKKEKGNWQFLHVASILPQVGWDGSPCGGLTQPQFSPAGGS